MTIDLPLIAAAPAMLGRPVIAAAWVQFESPAWFWALALLLPLVLFWHFKSYADLRPGRKGLISALRILGLLCVVTALSRPVLLRPNSDRTVLFLIDVSDSARAEVLDKAWAEIEAATQDLDSGETAGVVLFGGAPKLFVAPRRDALTLDDELRWKVFHKRTEEETKARIAALERGALDDAATQELATLQARLASIATLRSELRTEETDLEAALRLARGLLPLEARRRVVLASDGNANRGDVLRELVELERAGVSTHVRPLQAGDAPEVVAAELYAPAEAQVKAPFELEVAFDASVATTATVRVYRNKYLVSTIEDVALAQGRTLLALPKVRLEEGFHEFEVQVAPKDDTVLENNVARAVVRVAGRPKVLLIDREERDARWLESALRGEEIDVEVRPASGVPASLGELLNYDVLVLSDVPASAFQPGAMEAVKTYVREMGGGLVMIGGEQSFGLGGYYRTPIEDALPVKMPIKKNVEKPNLALALVIDKSGSMLGHKIELAKEAAIAAAEVLKDNDRFGVVAFDGASEWIAPMTDSSDLGAITGYISRLAAGGGTNIYPGLYDAFQALQEEDAKLKHIILLSDGQTEGSGYDTLVSHIAADGITLSTVGIGEGADMRLMEDMASWGNGESYFTNDFGSIPQIFTRETMRASKSMLIEEPFVPTQVAATEIVKGIPLDDMPFLLGYVGCQGKDRATISLVSDYGDPILANWTFGLGRSVAFTSDAKARWAADWISWDSYPKFWAQLVRSVMSTGAHKDLRTTTRTEVSNGVATVTLDVRDRAGTYRDDVAPELSILEGGDRDGAQLEVRHIAPGLFQASFPVERYGEAYRVLLVNRQDDEVVELRAFGVTESYSPEFRTAAPDLERLELIARSTGGVVSPTAEDVWRFEGEPARTPKDTWWWWLIAATFLLPLDIALRRLSS
ncbi:MAG: VWA domain-containing protein [Planctomycetota bacterium]